MVWTSYLQDYDVHIIKITNFKEKCRDNMKGTNLEIQRNIHKNENMHKNAKNGKIQKYTIVHNTFEFFLI